MVYAYLYPYALEPDILLNGGDIVEGDQENETIRIDSTIYLAGRFDEHFRRRKTADEILAGITPDLPVIMMDHRPTRLKEVSQTDTNIQSKQQANRRSYLLMCILNN